MFVIPHATLNSRLPRKDLKSTSAHHRDQTFLRQIHRDINCEAAMTLIPADTKDAKGPQRPPAMPTTNPFPNPILVPEFNHPDLPPYSETDTASHTRELPPPPPPRAQPPSQKIPESNAINAHSEVHITGPLHVLGYFDTYLHQSGQLKVM